MVNLGSLHFIAMRSMAEPGFLGRMIDVPPHPAMSDRQREALEVLWFAPVCVPRLDPSEYTLGMARIRGYGLSLPGVIPGQEPLTGRWVWIERVSKRVEGESSIDPLSVALGLQDRQKQFRSVDGGYSVQDALQGAADLARVGSRPWVGVVFRRGGRGGSPARLSGGVPVLNAVSAILEFVCDCARVGGRQDDETLFD